MIIDGDIDLCGSRTTGVVGPDSIGRGCRLQNRWRSPNAAVGRAEGKATWQAGADFPRRYGPTAHAWRVGRHRCALLEDHVFGCVAECIRHLVVHEHGDGRRVDATAVPYRDRVSRIG